MILAIDVGNTNIVFGLFRGRKLAKEGRFPTASFHLPAIKEKVEKVVIANVVPSLNKRLAKEVKIRFGIAPYFVSAENIPGLKVLLKNKKEIGADRVVNALAAHKLYGGPLVVVDFGTATTFDAVSPDGAYLGGAIAPGIMLARDALYARTAKLPKIEVKAPRELIGRNTLEAMRSGLVYGYAAMVEGMIARFKKELGGKAKVIATGGLSALICKYTTIVDRIDMKLTLKGLQMIGDFK